ncbi:MAG: pirin family protein [Planctomycetota bacterium JB042]
MITIRRSDERGHADHGWLDAYHTFSFAGYHDPDRMGFGPLRVLNQDRIAPARGFGAHDHRDMEIVTVVLEGMLEHRDSLGNGSIIRPGEVQVMSAGAGVTHSEANASPTEPLHLLQMWVFPRTRGTPPRYAQETIPAASLRGTLRTVVRPDGEGGALTIDQNARLLLGRLGAGDEARHALPAGRAAWIHVARGAVRLGETPLGPGDGAAVEDEEGFALRGVDDADVVVWDLPAARVPSPR